MTICYPQIIVTNLCPREELQSSLTSPTCVRVVPVYNDASYVISQFPPPVHFLVTDGGSVYQLAHIQSPPSTPQEYHAILDATGCILVGVELSSIVRSPITRFQISVLPGVLRHILQTLNLTINDVTNALPTQRCNQRLWQQIVDDTVDCLNTNPPPPPPVGLTCSFVRSCFSAGQNINISSTGVISSGQLIPGPNNDEYTWVGPDGNAIFSFVISGANINVADTQTVDLTLSGNTLSGSVNISAAPGNALSVNPDGLFISSLSSPCLNSEPNVVGLPTPNLLATFNSNTDCIEQINISPESILYGDPAGSGSPYAENLFYDPQNNYLRGIVGSTATLMPNSIALLSSSSALASGSNNLIVGANATLLGGPYNTIGVLDFTTLTNVSNSLLISSNSSINQLLRNGIVVANESITGSTSVSLVINEESAVSLSDASIVTARNSTLLGNELSLVISEDSTIQSSRLSLVSSFQSNQNSLISSSLISWSSNVNDITASNAILTFTGVRSLRGANAIIVGLREDTSPNLFFSAYYAFQSGSPLTNSPTIQYSLVTSSDTIFGDIAYSFSTIHSEESQFIQGSAVYHSFVSVRRTTVSSSFQSVLIASANQSISANNSLIAGGLSDDVTSRITSPDAIIDSSVIATRSLPLPDTTLSSVYVSRDIVRVSSLTSAAYIGENLQVNDPGINSARISNSLIVGNNHDVSSVTDPDSVLLVGSNLVAGRDTVFGVGYRAYTTPAIQNVGGWLAYIAYGGTDPLQNYFQGWQSAWRFAPFDPFNNFFNDASAIAALNAFYAGDPRLAFGTMVVTQVQGRPAIFSWTGTTFTRITV